MFCLCFPLAPNLLNLFVARWQEPSFTAAAHWLWILQSTWPCVWINWYIYRYIYIYFEENELGKSKSTNKSCKQDLTKMQHSKNNVSRWNICKHIWNTSIKWRDLSVWKDFAVWKDFTVWEDFTVWKDFAVWDFSVCVCRTSHSELSFKYQMDVAQTRTKTCTTCSPNDLLSQLSHCVSNNMCVFEGCVNNTFSFARLRA